MIHEMEGGLDEEFKHTVAEMKPHAKRLPQKSDERRRVTVWIKKLLTIKSERHERNEYARLLLHMLKSGKLEPPFLDNPPQGSLPRLHSFKPVANHQTLTSHSTNKQPQHTLPSSTGDVDQPVIGRQSTGTSKPVYSKAVHSTRDVSSRQNRDGASGKNKREKQASVPKPARSRSHSKEQHKSGHRLCHVEASTVKNESTSSQPLYLIQTNVPSGVGNHTQDQGSTITNRVNTHPTEDDYWSLNNRQSMTAPLGGHTYHYSTTSEDRQGPNAPFYPSTHPPVTSRLNPESNQLYSFQTSPQFVSRTPSPLKMNTSTKLEDLFPSSPSFSLSDDVLGSDSSGLSDVSELLMSQDHVTKSPTVPLTRRPFTASSSYTPQVSFTSSLPHTSSTGSPRKHDITRELLQTREIELKVKAAETRFEEEKLKTQRDHEESLKQIFDRKNNEIENLRTESRIKQSQLVAQIKRLEIKLSQAVKENKQLREEENQSMVDSRQFRLKLETQFDEKLHTVVSEFEHNKIELEQHYVQQNQRTLHEMSARISALKEDHASQRKTDIAVISKLKEKLQELSRESESLAHAHSALQQEKVELDRKYFSMEAELKTSQEKLEHVENQLSSLREEKDQQLKDLRTNAEQSVKSIQHEYSVQESKMSEALSQLKLQLNERERDIETIREEHRQRIAELESKGQRALRQKNLDHEKKVIELKREMSESEFQSKQNLVKLEEMVKDRDQQLEQLRVSLEVQSKQAEQAIDEFKTEVEQQTSGMFDQMRGELSHLEKELATSKAQSELEREQFSLQREQDKVREERLRGEMEHRHRQALDEMMDVHKSEIETQRKDLEMEKEAVVAKLSSNLSELEAQSKARATHTRKVIASLEEEVKSLRQQLESQALQHSREIESNELRGEEEIQAAVRIHEAAIGKLKTQLDNQKSKLRDDHKREIASLNEMHTHKLQQVEHEYTLRNNQSDEAINSLKTQVQFLEESLTKQQCCHEEHVREVTRRNEEERVSMKQHHEAIRQSLQQEADAAHLTVTQHQERNKHMMVEQDSKLSQLKLHYEEKLRGMLPVTVKHEYEDTIKSLRTQITILSQRASVLQDELHQRYSTQSYRPLHRLSSSSPNRPVTTGDL